MRKRYFPIATAISAAFVLAACSQTDVVDLPNAQGPAADNAISFGTYSAKAGGTRAGHDGNMTNDALKGWKEKQEGSDNVYKVKKGTGFGVFAYYTGRNTYGQHQKTTYSDETPEATTTAEGAINVKYPNFMYNQEVKFEFDDETGASTEGNWTYSPLKYWPNDFTNGEVDKKGATGSTENGGNVSFFAYAPYVDCTSAGAVTPNGTGIIAITANDKEGDPKITYKLPSKVDLLWGTFDNKNSTNVVDGDNSGVTGSNSADENTYKHAIVDGKTVAADLTKQKVGDKVKFNFIHALAAIGGSTETVDPEYKPEDVLTKSGFKVILDIDKDGAPKGGNREEFKIVNDKAVDATGESATHYRTVVTIKKVSITNDLNGDGKIEQGTAEDNSDDERLYSTGVLNLATGKWTGANGTQKGGDLGDSRVEQTIGGTEGGALAMNEDIAELVDGSSYFDKTEVSKNFEKNAKVKGVDENKAKNIYKDGDVSPILLIPGQKPKFRVNVVYVVRQYDDALATKYTEVENNITKIVTFPDAVEMNTRYALIMHLGLTGVKFTAEVSKWTKDGTTPSEGGGDDGDDDDTTGKTVEIELPSNVVE